MKQQGAALVIVMALLAGALMLGMSGMQSALIDERLAGNYRASVQSQMVGESYLAGVVSDENRDNLTSFIDSSLSDLEDGQSKVLSENEIENLFGSDMSDADSNLVVSISRHKEEITLRAWGTEAGAKSPTEIVFNSASAATSYRSPFLACLQIQLTGSSLAASCASSDAPCSLDPASFIAADSQTYNLLYSLGANQGDGITLDGNAQVYGSARSQRDIALTGSSSIKGSAYAQGAILHGDDTNVAGDGVEVEGVIQQCEDYLSIDPLTTEVAEIKSQYGGSAGDIVMGVYPAKQWLLTPEGLFYYDERDRARNCGIFGLGCLIADILNLFGFNLCELRSISCQQDKVGWVKKAPVKSNTIVVNDLILKQEPTFVVAGGSSNAESNPAQLKMVVEGELSVSGGGNGLSIEDNARLEFFVKGKTSLNSNLQMGSGSASRNGQAPLTINSSYVGSGDAVALSGNSHMVGNIYAPGGAVSINSSPETEVLTRVTGSIWAQAIKALDSQLIFNQANNVADSQRIDAETENDSATGVEWEWQ